MHTFNMEYIISLRDDTNIEQAFQKVQEPPCVLDPPRSDCVWDEVLVHEGAHRARALLGQVLLTTQQHPICVCAKALRHISHFEIVFIYESLCYSYPKLYLKCPWLAIPCGNKSQYVFTHINCKDVIFYSNRKSFLLYKRINNKHQFTCSIPHFTFCNYTSCPSSNSIYFSVQPYSSFSQKSTRLVKSSSAMTDYT